MSIPDGAQVAGCIGKLAYPNQRHARRVIRHQSRRGNKLRAYRCDLCFKWHLAGLR